MNNALMCILHHIHKKKKHKFILTYETKYENKIIINKTTSKYNST